MRSRMSPAVVSEKCVYSFIKMVLADVNYRQIPELRQVHHFVQNALTEPAFAEKTDGDLRGAQLLG